MAERQAGDDKMGQNMTSQDTSVEFPAHPARWPFALWFCAIAWSGLGTWLLLTESVPNSPSRISPYVAHGTLFFWVAVSATALVLRAGKSVRIATVAAICFAAGASEVLQAQTSQTRDGSLADFGVDLLGITGGLVGLGILRKVFRGPRRVETMAAISSFTALLVLCALLGASSNRAEHWRNCRNQQTDYGDQAVIVIEGDSVIVPANAPRETNPTVLPDSTNLACSVASTQELTVVAEISSTDQNQVGPTRIVSSSTGINGDEVNFHVGQSGDSLSIRLRRSSIDSRHSILVPGVFKAGQRQTISLVVADSAVKVHVDGALVGSFPIEDFSLYGWVEDFPLLIGDELSLDRTFIGDVHRVSIYNRALTPSDLVDQ